MPAPCLSIDHLQLQGRNLQPGMVVGAVHPLQVPCQDGRHGAPRKQAPAAVGCEHLAILLAHAGVAASYGEHLRCMVQKCATSSAVHSHLLLQCVL